MNNLMPINGHILIKPVPHESFISTTQDSYEEIGIVLNNGNIRQLNPDDIIPWEGDEVFFDSWLAAKYPDGEGGYYWLVRYEDIRAIKSAKDA